MHSDDPNANKRASYAEQAARAGAVPGADDEQPEETDASVARQAGFVRSPGSVSHGGVDEQSSRGGAEPPGADNIVTGDQAPLYGGAAHRERGEQNNPDDASASGGSSTSW